MREVQAAAKQQQGLASGLIKAGELAYICRPLAYVIALRMWGPVCTLLTKQFLCLLSVHEYLCACLVCYCLLSDCAYQVCCSQLWQMNRAQAHLLACSPLSASLAAYCSILHCSCNCSCTLPDQAHEDNVRGMGICRCCKSIAMQNRSWQSSRAGVHAALPPTVLHGKLAEMANRGIDKQLARLCSTSALLAHANTTFTSICRCQDYD